MSRIGKLPIPIPDGVSVSLDGQTVTVKGPKGESTLELRPEVTLVVTDGQAIVTIPGEDRLSRALYGLSRTLIANMVRGVSEGFQKELEIQGVGYRAALEGRDLVLSLGYSHPIRFTPDEGLELAVEKNIIRISGTDAQSVGQAAAEIRAFRPPEPYKGKGVRYVGEHVRRKAGKAGKAAG